MKQLYLLLFIVFVLISCNDGVSGDPVFIEDFSTNVNDWFETDTITVTGENYSIKNNTKEYIIRNNPVLHEERVEIVSKWLGGVENTGYGLLFKFQDFSHFNIFIISADGSFRIIEINEKPDILQEWKKTNAIKKQGQNILAINFESSSFTCFINDKKVGTYKTTLPDTGRSGIYVSKGIDLEFDDLKIWGRSAEEALSIEDVLPGMVTVNGNVTDGTQSVPGLEVRTYRILSLTDRIMIHEITTTADDSGNFAVEVMADYLYLIEAGVTEEEMKSGKGPYGGKIIDMQFAEDFKNITLELEKM